MNTKDKVKLLVRKFVASGYYVTGRYKTLLRGKVLLLMYHRVLDDDDAMQPFIQPGMYVTKSSFQKQMRFIRKNFHVLSFSELLDLWQTNGIDASKTYCVVTFDDGWRDNFVNAYPG